jgi:hypothetical protein
LIAAALTLPGCAILQNVVAHSVHTPIRQVAGKQVAGKAYRSMPPYRSARARPTKALRSKTAVSGEKPGCDTSSDCLSRLRALVESEKREWIGRTVPPAEYATGVRLFAYRALRSRLTCKELGLALAEIDLATRTLHGPIAGVTTEQIGRTRILNAQIEGELRAERARRCGV